MIASASDILDRSVKLEMKILLVLAPVCLIVMAYALARGDLSAVGSFALIEIVILMRYRNEKRRLGP